MSQRFPVSGTNAAALLAATASSNQQIYGITSGRVFWLRGISVAPNATTGPLSIKDATVGSTATTPVVVVPMILLAAGVGPQEYMVNYGAPGIKFSTGVVAMLDASGSVPIGACTVWGFEE